MKKLEDIFDSKDEIYMDNYIWTLSVLALLLINNFDKEQPIINVFLGGE